MTVFADGHWLLDEPKELFCPARKQLIKNVKVGPMVKMYNNYGGGIEHCAQIYGLKPEVALAVFATEAGAEGAFVENRVTIRVEARPPVTTLRRFNSKGPVDINGKVSSMSGEQEFIARFRRQTDIIDGSWITQRAEWRALAAWYDIEEKSGGHPTKGALYWTSFGLPQILAMNYEAAGFASQEDMLILMQESAYNQVRAFFRLVENWRLIKSLNAMTPNTQTLIENFVKGYNGAGQVQVYSAKLKKNLITAETVYRMVKSL